MLAELLDYHHWTFPPCPDAGYMEVCVRSYSMGNLRVSLLSSCEEEGAPWEPQGRESGGNLITTEFFISSILAVFCPIALQKLRQTDRYVAARECPQTAAATIQPCIIQKGSCQAETEKAEKKNLISKAFPSRSKASAYSHLRYLYTQLLPCLWIYLQGLCYSSKRARLV